MKRWFKHTLASLMVLVLALTSQTCGRKAQKAMETENDEIKSIAIVSAGGQLGYSSFFEITKDSIKFSSHLAVDTTRNIAFSKRINPQDWNDMIGGIDLEIFKNATNGHSVQPVDGIDTEIIVKTNDDEISRLNAYDNEVWRWIEEKRNKYDIENDK